MNVLIACEESQAVCMAFRFKGHNAFSCDIQECSGGHPEFHIKADVTTILSPVNISNGVVGIHFQTCDNNYYFVDRWDLIIAHPPCTYMSKAGARWMYKSTGVVDEERLKAALAAKDFFNRILCADCDKIAIENPVPLKIVGLPPYTQKIQPFEFGHPYSKATCLWLKGLPILHSTCIIEDYVPFLPSNTSCYSKGKGGSKGVAQNSISRSKTFSGIAAAMADQWGCLL